MSLCSMNGPYGMNGPDNALVYEAWRNSATQVCIYITQTPACNRIVYNSTALVWLKPNIFRRHTTAVFRSPYEKVNMDLPTAQQLIQSCDGNGFIAITNALNVLVIT